MCKYLQQLLKDNEDYCDDVSNDPIARAGSVVGDILEDNEKQHRGELRALLNSGKLCDKHTKEALDLLGDIAQNEFDSKVYR